MTPLLLNPAQAGTEANMRGILNYRNQWGSVAFPYVTSDISWDMQIPQKEKKAKSFHAVGLAIFHDKAGDAQLKTLQANLSYAYHVHLNENSTLGAGITAGYAQHSIEFASLQWMNQYNGSSYDPLRSTGEPNLSATSFNNFDLGAGVHYAYGKGERYMTANDQVRYNGGIAVHHVNRPNNSFYDSGEKLNMKIAGYANAIAGIGNSNFALVPSIMYIQQGKTTELILGSMFRYTLRDESKYTGFAHASALSVGIHYRGQDAVITSLLFEIASYSIGISYDVNVSGLTSASNGRGGFELSLRFLSLNPVGAAKSTTGE
jgi:type IX secretion system PorP/SprF family membrane protein